MCSRITYEPNRDPVSGAGLPQQLRIANFIVNALQNCSATVVRERVRMQINTIFKGLF